MLAISNFCVAHPEIEELDLNPVLAYPQGMAVLDVRILLAPDDGDRTGLFR